MFNRRPYLLEFHVSRQARDFYRFDDAVFSYNGNVVFANLHAARVFAQNMNDRKNLALFPEQAVRAGQINAMALIDEILHVVLEHYRQERNPRLMDEALAWLGERIGDEELDLAFGQFLAEFPPTAVYRQEVSNEEYLQGESIRPDGGIVPNRQLILEEMLMLYVANLNPAYAPHLELFDDETLEKRSAYLPIMAGLKDFFDTQPPIGTENTKLFELLRAPAMAAPHSLTDQLEFMRTRWVGFLGKLIYRLLGSLDLVKEEEKVTFGFGGGEGVPAAVYEFAGLEVEPENFSQDLDWMPRLVILAKNSFVWLDQLSKKYKRPITRLDEIPDEELDTLARWGLTGLWLIGLWERSKASQVIKQLRGNPEAVASAYSLMRYDIAADLGGEAAYQDLKSRAWQRGIRLASDMVPNHMGIDSNWVIEHPDWFINLDYPPFPSYSFNGPNLSGDNRVGIYIEDHYFDNSDAAVVFKRTDFWTGSTKFIYHGNDGTSMPWNDTAQLNYLSPEVREAVIQTILHVARQFPIIRFDAAMTLAKKHYQRLWYPEPGHGGDIASRSDFALTREQFDAAFPAEFWREVVDRIASEAPDTLLLAEAFWLMEGYFVRTLGMHRVYNSAFMNMLRDEKNQEYRQVIKNTLEFEPEILKRYVNFMNNPDERTAVDQFGKGDKYFGILTMMITMPGLPMLGHGQIEGFTEKYGMEYRRAYWDEHPDGYLVERHEREIFPLVRKRYMFAEVENFLFYDFYTQAGSVNEDVFAYSNVRGAERALILYNNRYASTRGWIRTSTPPPQKLLGEGLQLHDEPDYYVIFKEQNSAMEFIRSSQELFTTGLYVELDAYQCQVLVNFREVLDDEARHYGRLAEFLNGRPVPDVEEALREIFLEPLHTPYRELVNPGWFNWLTENRLPSPAEPEGKTAAQAVETTSGEPEGGSPVTSLEIVLNDAENRILDYFEAAKTLSKGDGDPEAIAAIVRRELEAALSIASLRDSFNLPSGSGISDEAWEYFLAGPPGRGWLDEGDPLVWGTIWSFIFNHLTGQAALANGSNSLSQTWIDEWLLGKIIARTLRDAGADIQTASRQVELLKILVGAQDWFSVAEMPAPSAYQVLQAWLNDHNVHAYLKVNRFQGVLWFNKESYEELLWWMFAVCVIQSSADLFLEVGDASITATAIERCFSLIEKLREAKDKSNFQLENLLLAVEN